MLLSRIVWQRIFALAMGNVARYRRRPRKPASKRVSPWGTGNRLWVMLLATVADAIASKDCRVQHRSWESTSRSWRSEEHTSELQSLMRISYAVFCLKKKTTKEYKNNILINDVFKRTQ